MPHDLRRGSSFFFVLLREVQEGFLPLVVEADPQLLCHPRKRSQHLLRQWVDRRILCGPGDVGEEAPELLRVCSGVEIVDVEAVIFPHLRDVPVKLAHAPFETAVEEGGPGRLEGNLQHVHVVCGDDVGWPAGKFESADGLFDSGKLVGRAPRLKALIGGKLGDLGSQPVQDRPADGLLGIAVAGINSIAGGWGLRSRCPGFGVQSAHRPAGLHLRQQVSVARQRPVRAELPCELAKGDVQRLTAGEGLRISS